MYLHNRSKAAVIMTIQTLCQLGFIHKKEDKNLNIVIVCNNKIRKIKKLPFHSTLTFAVSRSINWYKVSMITITD